MEKICIKKVGFMSKNQYLVPYRILENITVNAELSNKVWMVN